MSWSLVQSGHAEQAAGSSLIWTPGSNVAVGNRLIVVVYTYGSGITLSGVSDSLGNGGAVGGQYDRALAQPDAFNGHIYFLTVPIVTGGSCTITAAASSSASFMSAWWAEASGLSQAVGSNAWDVTASNGGTIATSMSTGSTPNVGAAGQLALAAYGDTYANATGALVSPGSPWSELFNDHGTVSNRIPLVVDSQTPASGSPASATWTFGNADGGNGWASGLVVFKTFAAPGVGGVGGPMADITGAYWVT